MAIKQEMERLMVEGMGKGKSELDLLEPLSPYRDRLVTETTGDPFLDYLFCQFSDLERIAQYHRELTELEAATGRHEGQQILYSARGPMVVPEGFEAVWYMKDVYYLAIIREGHLRLEKELIKSEYGFSYPSVKLIINTGSYARAVRHERGSQHDFDRLYEDDLDVPYKFGFAENLTVVAVGDSTINNWRRESKNSEIVFRALDDCLRGSGQVRN